MNLNLYLAMASLFNLFLSPATHAAEVAGKAVNVSGRVLVRNINEPSGEMHFLKVGDPVLAGTLINTGSTASAKLLMTDKTILDLGPSSLFRVDEYKLAQVSDRKVDVSVEYGKVRASVNEPVGTQGKFNVRTRSATLGVRGTEFIVDAPQSPEVGKSPIQVKNRTLSSEPSQKVSVTVVHGSVAMMSEAPANRGREVARIGAGQQIQTSLSQLESLTKSEKPKMVTLSGEQLLSVKTEAKLADSTFSAAVSIDPASHDRSESNGTNSGAQTMSAITQSVVASTSSIEISPPMVPGTFTPADSITISQNRPIPTIANLSVAFKK